jgi:hypothetical protein
MAFADATSGGQEVCPIPAEADRPTTATLNPVTNSFFMFFILPSSC